MNNKKTILFFLIALPMLACNNSDSKIHTTDSSNESTSITEKKILVFDEDLINKETAFTLEFEGDKVTVSQKRKDGSSYWEKKLDFKDGKIISDDGRLDWLEIEDNSLRSFDTEEESFFPFNRSKSTVDIADILAKDTKFQGNEVRENTSNMNSKPTKKFDEIQLTLTDGSIKKAHLYLGEPDKEEHGFGHETKGLAIYFDKVSNAGKRKHLILFLRRNGNFWGNEAKIEEIYAIDDNEKACFGIHCIKIKEYKIYTNAIDLFYYKGYEKL